MGMRVCFLLPATSNKMPGQSDYSTHINGNQLGAERWENWFLKDEVEAWMTFYYSREMMIHSAGPREFVGGGKVLD